VEARVLSSLKDERSLSARIFPMPIQAYCGDANRLVQDLGDALYASKICAYAQGMALLRQAARVFDYPWDGETIARIWRGGCIIRARFLDDVGTAFNKTPDLANLLIANFFAEAVSKRHGAWRRVVATAATLGIPFPAISASLAYFDAYRSARLPANLIQAQRDYFGAHTYRRTDRDGIFHTQWNP
jgi:6-phosphogluconate dehydrogenase